jgi:hypothetical protein
MHSARDWLAIIHSMGIPLMKVAQAIMEPTTGPFLQKIDLTIPMPLINSTDQAIFLVAT